MNPVIATGGGVHKLSGLLKNDLYKCALLGSFVLSLISFLGLPAVLHYGELHRDIWRALLATGFILTALVAVLFLTALGYFTERQVRADKSRCSFFPTLKAGRCVRMRFRSGSARIFSSLRHDFFRPVFFLTEFPFLQYHQTDHRYYHDSAQRSCSADICAAASGFFPFRSAICRDDPGRAGDRQDRLLESPAHHTGVCCNGNI